MSPPRLTHTQSDRLFFSVTAFLCLVASLFLGWHVVQLQSAMNVEFSAAIVCLICTLSALGGSLFCLVHPE